MKTSWRDVLRECLALAKPFGTERIARRSAQGRVLAEDIRADRDYPEGDLSMMDGYAVGAEAREAFVVEGENTPGARAGAPLANGTARRIFTGAELPSGATRIVPQELVRRDGDKLFINQWPDTDFVRPRGREAKQGGRRARPRHEDWSGRAGGSATVGCREVGVVKRPHVSHLTTGDEIVSPDEPLPAGKIRDSNSDLIAGLLAHCGLVVSRHARVSDDRELAFAK